MPREELKFRIEAYTPETIPMARLADYLAPLAVMLGEPASVHFVRLEAGSTVVAFTVESEAVPKVLERTASVRRGDGPTDALRAYKTINKFLRDDNGCGVINEGETGAEIIRFPGREEVEEVFASIQQYGTLEGEVIRVGGPKQLVPIILQSEDEQITRIWSERRVAKLLGQYLFEPVRLFGRGKWTRDAEGKWSLSQFVVDNFDILSAAPLSQALLAIRAVEVEWNEAALTELTEIRG